MIYLEALVPQVLATQDHQLRQLCSESTQVMAHPPAQWHKYLLLRIKLITSSTRIRPNNVFEIKLDKQ